MPSLNLALSETAAPSRTAYRHSSDSAASVGRTQSTLRRKPSAGILTTTTTPSGARTTRITATALPAVTAASATPSRAPLRVCDQNVGSARRPLKPTLAPRLAPHAPRMPNEKPPTMPTVARGINKPPLTPKVASRAAAPTLQAQNPPLVTPLARRGAPRPDSVLSSNGAGSREREDVASPVSVFLSTNITQRSASRQVRVDSANSTPTSTPKLERYESWDTRSGLVVPGSATDDGQRRPASILGSPMEAQNGTRGETDSKFFYASDVQRAATQSAPPKPMPTLQKSATFFYANGDSVQGKDKSPSIAFTPVLTTPTPSQDTSASKFVYANGIPDLPSPTARPAGSQPPAPSSVVSTSSRIPTTRPGTALSQAAYSRPTSPVKVSAFSPTLSAANLAPSSRSPVSTTNPPGGQAAQRGGRPARGHARSGSLTSNLTIAEPPAVARILSEHSSLTSSEASSPVNGTAPALGIIPNNPAVSGFASLLQAADDFAEEDDAKPDSLNSPTKSPSQEKQLTDLVASARRERKVQDLEITNASLEAINRTLERQLRKQTAEIRRYRRLSRSGRLSLASVHSRIPSDSTVDGGALARAGMGLDDLSEEESEDEAHDDDLDDEDDFSSSEASGDLNPGELKLRDARHRQRDEQRLQLDLSKHQQLLIDSQKINQSLKRCLGWTEELIKEGKRALEYRVRVSEVEIGGRVLAPEDLEARASREAGGIDEDEDETIHSTDLLMEEVYSAPFTAQPWSKEPQDRDSGIELPTDGG
ncbi:hypothetical protein QBC47DRAFT_42977 [Echria macrotheca]|uniref:Uncharacterized protein n=1 Tax=Echria macrotheca TaxID=438768 RepID=A0AAJ0BAH5_9PEZI|nr:hypothetical protein QBC47DRAFT_42977 [Echria macrotheca]